MNKTAKKGDKIKYTGLVPYKSVSANAVLLPNQIYEVEETLEDFSGITYMYKILGKRLWLSSLRLFELQLNNDL